MSKLFKSKFLLGIVVVAVLLLGVAVVAPKADAASCSSFTMSIMKYGSRGADVKCLQEMLNEKGYLVSSTGAGSPGMESQYFGTKTKSAVMAFQSAMGLVSDGVVGSMTKNALMTSTGTGTGTGTGMGTLPAGCTTNVGYSPVTGQKCEYTTGTTVPGCMPGYMFSPTTGQSCTGGTTTTPQTGPVTVMLPASNPASGTLVAGQATADLLHLAFSGTGTVTNVVLKRIGVSADTTPSNVYLFDGATRLTDAASVASNGLVTFNSASGLFMVSGSKTVAVKSDIALSTSGQTVGFELVSFTVSGGTATTVNLMGNLHTIAQSTLASVSAGPVTPTGATLNPGANVTVWQSTLTVSQRDVMMKRFTLRNVGSAPASAFGGFKLFVNGTQVATATGVDANGYVTFDMMSAPVTLQSGARIVRVDADIVSGASRTVHFSLRSAADVDFVDSSFGVNITPTSAPWSPTTASTISSSTGGTVTVEKDVTSPSINLVNGANDAVLGVFKVTAFGESIKIETMTAGFTYVDTVDDNPAGAGSTATLRNGRLLFSTDGTNWVQYGSTSTVAAAGTSFTTNYTVVPGTPVWVQVRADVYDNDGTGDISATDTLVATLVQGSANAQKLDSLGSLNVPSANVSANTLTVGTTSLSLTEDTTYADQTMAVPVTGAKIGVWNLAGSSLEDVLITTLSFEVDEVVGATLNEDDLTNMYVVVRDSATNNVVYQSSPLATVAATSNSYSLNYTIVKNTAVKVELYANLATGATDTHSFSTGLVVTGTSLVSGSAVNAAEVTGQTIAAGAATITATKDASSPVASIVYDNQTVTGAAFRFAAVTAGYNVTDLTFTLANATVAQSVMLYDGATLVATRPGAATVVFSGLSWNVPANTNKVLTVKLQLGSVGIGAGTSGSSQLVTLTGFTAVNTSTGVSDASANDAGPSIENDPAGSAMYAYAALPTMAKGTLANDKLANGENSLVRFSITANGGDIEWTRLFFEVTKTADPVLTNATLWDVTGGGNTEIAGTDTLTTVGATNTSGTIEFDATAVQSVSGTRTYELRITASAVDVNVDSVVTKLAGDAVYAAGDSAANVETADADVTIIWSDMSASGHSTSTNDWTGEYGILGLPISQTISSAN